MADVSEREFGEHLVALITAALDEIEPSLVPLLINELSENEVRQQLAACLHYIANMIVKLEDDPQASLQSLGIFVSGLPEDPPA